MTFEAGESLAARIAGYLSQEIIRGNMRSGERIQEARVVSALDVSRGSVREALLLLEKCHLVTILPRRGAFVTELNEVRVRSIYDLYVTLLTMLATLLAQNWSDETARTLNDKAAMAEKLAAEQDPYRFIEAGFAVMDCALQLAGNEYLLTIMKDMQPALYRTSALAIRFSPQEAGYAGHFISGLIAAAAAGNEDTIRKLVREYGSHQCDLVLRALHNHSTQS